MKTSFYVFLCAFLMISLSISCSSDDPESQQEEQEMEQDMEEETLSGNYFGTWDSTTPTVTFTGFAITAKFVVNASNSSRIDADFFATDNYTSCCSTTNPNDGTMRINLDGSAITSFTFNDTIVDCEGSFTGSGFIDATGAFVIDFTGNDCDGAHVGQLIFRK
ncbi:MAG: hypothetical protein ACI828_001373 [Flavobacteriales bacterium]|jgi:hypothetical protein